MDRAHRLSVSQQARLREISRGSVYDQRRPPSAADLALMRRIDALHLEYPFAGSRMLRGLLRQEGSIVGRLHVATLMKQMGIMALYRRPTTSHPTPGHQIYPYLLRKLAVTRPNHVSTCGPSARLVSSDSLKCALASCTCHFLVIHPSSRLISGRLSPQSTSASLGIHLN